MAVIIRTVWTGPIEKLTPNGVFFKLAYTNVEEWIKYLKSLPGFLGTYAPMISDNQVSTEIVFDTEEHAASTGIASNNYKVPTNIIANQSEVESYMAQNGIVKVSTIVPA